MASSEAAVNVPFFKKGKSRPTTSRKRSVSPAAATPDQRPPPTRSQVVYPTRKSQTSLLSAGTKRTSSQRDEGADGVEEEESREKLTVQWTASGSHVNAALEILAVDQEEELLEKRRKKEHEVAGGDEEAPDGVYMGQKAYKSHVKKNTEVPKSMRIGPQRGTSTIRTVTIVDYQPDVCKDYKETGYCGYGDSCKFLHDRGTYLAGWQLDKIADQPNHNVQDESESDSDDDIPFACLICRKRFTEPVVTRCGHYFCSACAIKRFTRTPKCAACGTPTGGIFNRADKVIAKMNEAPKDMDMEEGDYEGQGDREAKKLQIEGLKEEEGEEEGQ